MILIRTALEADDHFVIRLAQLNKTRVDPSRERSLPHAVFLIAEVGRGSLEQNFAQQDVAQQKLAGFVLGWVVSDQLEVLDLIVDPPARGRGVATELVRALFDEALKRGAKNAFLEVKETNVVAQALYKKLGFVEEGRRPRYYQGGEDALLLRCCLTART